MLAAVPWNKSLYMKEWMVQADPPKEWSTFERGMTGYNCFLQIKWRNALKNEQFQAVFLEKYITPKNIWYFK